MFLNKFSKFLPETSVKKRNFSHFAPLCFSPLKNLPGAKITHWTAPLAQGLMSFKKVFSAAIIPPDLCRLVRSGR